MPYQFLKTTYILFERYLVALDGFSQFIKMLFESYFTFKSSKWDHRLLYYPAVLISINPERTKINQSIKLINHFQFYSVTGPTNTKLVLNEQVQRSWNYLVLGARIMILILFFCYFYFAVHLTFINNKFGFIELSAGAIFIAKEDGFLQISIEGFKSGQLFTLLGTHTVKGKSFPCSPVPFS